MLQIKAKTYVFSFKNKIWTHLKIVTFKAPLSPGKCHSHAKSSKRPGAVGPGGLAWAPPVVGPEMHTPITSGEQPGPSCRAHSGAAPLARRHPSVGPNLEHQPFISLEAPASPLQRLLPELSSQRSKPHRCTSGTSDDSESWTSR